MRLQVPIELLLLLLPSGSWPMVAIDRGNHDQHQQRYSREYIDMSTRWWFKPWMDSLFDIDWLVHCRWLMLINTPMKPHIYVFLAFYRGDISSGGRHVWSTKNQPHMILKSWTRLQLSNEWHALYRSKAIRVRRNTMVTTILVQRDPSSGYTHLNIVRTYIHILYDSPNLIQDISYYRV